MTLFNEDRLFHYIDISKNPQCKSIKFKRAFQFLQLFLIQRIYGIDIITHSLTRRSSKQKQKCDFEVFLGGSCNPTTWRYEQAIPYFQTRSISYYNPQVANWTPELIDIEYRAKESAPLLFFVIDNNTRSLAAIAEVCYLAARGRNIIVVMNQMPEDKNQTKFIQQKNFNNKKDNDDDYNNVCQARTMLRILLQSINIHVFDNVKVALECAAFLSEYFDYERNGNLFDFRQTSYSINESDDDGYFDSIESSNRTSSRSSSISLDFSDENKPSRFHQSIMQSFFIFCAYPFRFIKNLILPPITNHFEHSPSFIFDLYIAFGDYDEYWLNTSVFPFLERINVKYIKREMSNENNIHIYKRSCLLYYLINDHERLSYLINELAFIIGERQYEIIVYLQLIINENCAEILTKNERQDIERSRKYLEDLAKKEKIFLYQSREQSWQHVLDFFLHD